MCSVTGLQSRFIRPAVTFLGGVGGGGVQNLPVVGGYVSFDTLHGAIRHLSVMTVDKLVESVTNRKMLIQQP